MNQASYQVYRYRWIVLLAFMLVTAANQLLWITFAPITGEAARYYNVSDLSIGLLSLVFMVVYIALAIPAAWVIDSFGLRVGVGIGAALTGLFGLLRGLAAASYPVVLAAQVGIAIGQPFILNALTTVAARWFPLHERATAAGLGSLSIYLGILAGLALTPYLTLSAGLAGMLMIYGGAALAAGVVFFAAARERPPTPPCPPELEARSLVLDGLRNTLHNRDFWLLMGIFFVGLGTFNAVTTWIEQIIQPRGFSIVQAGDTGAMMIAGGILGALVIPLLSDRYRRRTPFLMLGVIGAILGLAGITYAAGYGLLMFSAFVLGFFLLSAGPVGFQYGAEVTYPTPEGTSNALLLLMGQISGIIFILGMDSFKSPLTGSMSLPLDVLIGLLVLCLVACARLKDTAPRLVGS
jgi:sugar phosphate permease